MWEVGKFVRWIGEEESDCEEVKNCEQKRRTDGKSSKRKYELGERERERWINNTWKERKIVMWIDEEESGRTVDGEAEDGR